jgi:hypothetical protein
MTRLCKLGKQHVAKSQQGSAARHPTAAIWTLTFEGFHLIVSGAVIPRMSWIVIRRDSKQMPCADGQFACCDPSRANETSINSLVLVLKITIMSHPVISAPQVATLIPSQWIVVLPFPFELACSPTLRSTQFLLP